MDFASGLIGYKYDIIPRTRTKCTLGGELFDMTLYDQICEQAIGNYGLITTMDAESLGVRRKDLVEPSRREWEKAFYEDIVGRGKDVLWDDSPIVFVWGRWHSSTAPSATRT